jgi:hypothetical protein
VIYPWCDTRIPTTESVECCAQRSNAFRYFNSKMVALPQGECNHKGEKRSKRARDSSFRSAEEKWRRWKCRTDAESNVIPLLLLGFTFLVKGARFLWLMIAGATAQDISGRFFLLIFLLSSSDYGKKKGREGEVSQNGRASALAG